MKLIIKYCQKTMKRYPGVVLKAMALILVITILNAMVPYGMRFFLNQIVPTNNYWYMILGIIVFGIYLTLKTFFDMGWYVVLDELGGKCITDLSVELETALAETSQTNIDEEQTGKIKHTMYADVLDVFRVIGHHLPTLMGSVAVIVSSLILASLYDVKVTLFIFAALLFGVLLAMASRNILARKAGKTNMKLKAHHGMCDQFVDQLPLIQTNPVLPYFVDKTRESISDFITTSQKEDGVQVFWSKAVSNYNVLFSLALSAILSLPMSGASIANLVFFMSLSDIIMSEGQKSELLLQQIVRAKVSFENVDRLLRLKKRQGEEIIERIKEITFEDVNFAYREGGEDVLKRISYTIKAGENIRLVGGNGSGKSTFIKLLTGVYSPRAGKVCLNGREISNYSRESLNERILYINQDETLLNESIHTYLELVGGQGLEQAKLDEMLKWLTLEGVDRKIENNGLSLSVGQRKKLLILKLMQRCEKASVIILDEIEAGLDQITRAKYIEFLKTLFLNQEKIVLVVEHDISEDIQFDRIIRFGE